MFQNPIFLSGRETSNGLLFCTERNNLGIFSRTFVVTSVIALTSLSHSLGKPARLASNFEKGSFLTITLSVII